MSYLKKIFPKSSIRLLVIALATVSTLACVVLGAAATYSNQQLSKGQVNLTQISAIQESSARASESLINFQNRQATILAARTQESINALADRSSLTSQYQQASDALKQLINNDPVLDQLLQELDSQFKAFSITDESIYAKSKEIIEHKKTALELADKIDDQLNEIDSLVGSIIGKIRFTEKRNKRKIKRLLKKIDTSSEYIDIEDTSNLIDNVNNVVLGKGANHLETVNNIKSDSLSLSAFARQLLSTTDIDTVLSLRQNKINQHVERIRGLLETLEVSFSGNNELRDLTHRLTATLEEFLSTAFFADTSIYSLQLEDIKSGHQQKDLLVTASDDASALNNIVYKLSQNILGAREKITMQSQANSESSRWLVLLITVSVIILLVTLSVFIIIGINKPLYKVSSALHEIALGDGDLTQRLETSGIREVASIALEFNRFVEKIATAINQVNKASTDLSISSDTLKKVSDQTRADIKIQQGETHGAASAIAEMSKAAKSIADNAEQARLSSQDVRTESENSNQTVTEVATAIGNLAIVIEKASHSINELEQFSASIGTVLDVIRGIAEQTNLLALNAAIEAARAGEQGRGFAVVADEVRSLASRTQESTIEIENMIQQLQSGAQVAVKAIEEGNKGASRTVVQANEAATSLTKITDAIISISEMNTTIASAAEEQSAVSQEIDANVEAIRQVGERTVKGTEDITSSGEDLFNLNSELQSLMAQFKV